MIKTCKTCGHEYDEENYWSWEIHPDYDICPDCSVKCDICGICFDPADEQFSSEDDSRECPRCYETEQNWLYAEEMRKALYTSLEDLKP